MTIFSYHEQRVGEVAVLPRFVRITTDSDHLTIESPEFVKQLQESGNPLNTTDIIFIAYREDDVDLIGIYHFNGNNLVSLLNLF